MNQWLYHTIQYFEPNTKSKGVVTTHPLVADATINSLVAWRLNLLTGSEYYLTSSKYFLTGSKNIFWRAFSTFWRGGGAHKNLDQLTYWEMNRVEAMRFIKTDEYYAYMCACVWRQSFHRNLNACLLSTGPSHWRRLGAEFGGTDNNLGDRPPVPLSLRPWSFTQTDGSALSQILSIFFLLALPLSPFQF